MSIQIPEEIFNYSNHPILNIYIFSQFNNRARKIYCDALFTASTESKKMCFASLS